MPRPAKRPVRDQLDAVRDAVTATTPFSTLVSCQRLNSTCTAEISVMRRASSIWPTLTLHRPIRSTSPSFLERGERAHARRERRPRVGRVKLIQMNAFDAERTQARFARGAQMARPSVGHPLALRSRQATLGGNDDAGAVAAPCAERARNESLVVADVGVVQAICVSRIEERDAAVERGMQHTDGASSSSRSRSVDSRMQPMPMGRGRRMRLASMLIRAYL